MTTSGTITITARTLDLAREALAAWIAEYPRRALDALALIGWAFTAGIALAVFLLPCYILDAAFKDREKKSATPPPENTP